MTLVGIICLIIISPLILICGFISLAIIYGVIYTMISSMIDAIKSLIGESDEHTK